MRSNCGEPARAHTEGVERSKATLQTAAATTMRTMMAAAAATTAGQARLPSQPGYAADLGLDVHDGDMEET